MSSCSRAVGAACTTCLLLPPPSPSAVTLFSAYSSLFSPPNLPSYKISRRHAYSVEVVGGRHGLGQGGRGRVHPPPSVVDLSLSLTAAPRIPVQDRDEWANKLAGLSDFRIRVINMRNEDDICQELSLVLPGGTAQSGAAAHTDPAGHLTNCWAHHVKRVTKSCSSYDQDNSDNTEVLRVMPLIKEETHIFTQILVFFLLCVLSEGWKRAF